MRGDDNKKKTQDLYNDHSLLPGFAVVFWFPVLAKFFPRDNRLHMNDSAELSMHLFLLRDEAKFPLAKNQIEFNGIIHVQLSISRNFTETC